MECICPKCLSQIEYEADTTEIKCQSCGMKFDPSQMGDDLPPLEMAMASESEDVGASEPSQLSEPLNEANPLEESSEEASEMAEDGSAFPSIEEQLNHVEEGALPPIEASSEAMEEDADFTKSEAMFQELRDFGESLMESPEEGAGGEEASPAVEEAAAPAAVAMVPDEGEAPTEAPTVRKSAMPMTSGAALQGFQITTYFTPLSLSLSVNADVEEPFAPAFEKFMSRAKQEGGNGVVDLRWELSKDGQKVLICGTPVACEKVS